MSDIAEIQSRVDRERAAHTEDDVLARSYELKGRFPHVLTYPSHKRLNEAFERIEATILPCLATRTKPLLAIWPMRYLAAAAR